MFGAAGASIHLGDLPPRPPTAIAVYPKTAPPGDFSQVRNQAVQVVVRVDATGQRPGYQKACAVRDELHGLRRVTLAEGTEDETRLVWLKADGDEPLPLGADSTGAQRWSLRFVAQTVHDTALTIL